MNQKVLSRICAAVICLAMVATLAIPTGASAAARPKIVTAIKNNKSYNIMNPLMLKWYKGFQPGKTKTKIYAKFSEKSHPSVVTLKWKLKGAGSNVALKNVTVKVSMTKNMKYSKKNPVKTYKVRGEVLELTNLFVGKRYYWQVTGKYRGKTLKSPIYTFRTNWTTRTLKVDGASNVRDLGGYKVPGGRVRQGMIYRSGNLDQLSKKGIATMNKELGVKKQLDLRRPTGEQFIGNKKLLGAKKYINISAIQYQDLYTDGVDKSIIAKELAVFANKNNYPIVFHCMIGRDRTGTLAFLINALLGVNKKNLYADYEMSFFSVSGCYSVTSSKSLTTKFNALYNYISNRYKGSKLNMKQRTEKFLIEECKVNPAHIKNIRKIMIEKGK